MNNSSIYQLLDFALDDAPADSISYFGFQSQRIPSHPDDPTVSLLIELVYLSVAVNGVVVGSLNGQTSYPDKGSGDISSTGEAVWPVFTASGIFSGVKSVVITFFPDLSRRVRFIG